MTANVKNGGRARKKPMGALRRREYGFATALLAFSIVLFLIFGLYSQILSILQCFQDMLELYPEYSYL